MLISKLNFNNINIEKNINSLSCFHSLLESEALKSSTLEGLTLKSINDNDNSKNRIIITDINLISLLGSLENINLNDHTKTLLYKYIENKNNLVEQTVNKENINIILKNLKKDNITNMFVPYLEFILDISDKEMLESFSKLKSRLNVESKDKNINYKKYMDKLTGLYTEFSNYTNSSTIETINKNTSDYDILYDLLSNK